MGPLNRHKFITKFLFFFSFLPCQLPLTILLVVVASCSGIRVERLGRDKNLEQQQVLQQQENHQVQVPTPPALRGEGVGGGASSPLWLTTLSSGPMPQLSATTAASAAEEEQESAPKPRRRRRSILNYQGVSAPM